MSKQDALNRYAFTPKQQLMLLLCNAIQFVHLAAVLAVLVVPWAPLPCRVPAGLAVLYLLPPLLVRLAVAVFPMREGRITPDEPSYMTWWLVINLQMIFNRLPWLDELLRVVPALYSAWLRMYGSRVGRFTYWAAGTRILDRSLLDIGDGVVLGAGTTLSPHLVVRDDDGVMQLNLGRVVIEDRAVIGGFSALGAGTRITADECTRAFLMSPPFTTWRGGKRISRDNLADREAPDEAEQAQ